MVCEIGLYYFLIISNRRRTLQWCSDRVLGGGHRGVSVLVVRREKIWVFGLVYRWRDWGKGVLGRTRRPRTSRTSRTCRRIHGDLSQGYNTQSINIPVAVWAELTKLLNRNFCTLKLIFPAYFSSARDLLIISCDDVIKHMTSNSRGVVLDLQCMQWQTTAKIDQRNWLWSLQLSRHLLQG